MGSASGAVRSSWPVELERTAARIADVKLARPPRRVRGHPRGPPAGLGNDAPGREKLRVDGIDIADEEPVGGTINGVVPLARVRPLEVEFHGATPHPSVLR